MEPLTARQQQVLDFINDAQAQTGVIPTREIQEHFGFASQTAAMNHLKALERKGDHSSAGGQGAGGVCARQLPRQPIAIFRFSAPSSRAWRRRRSRRRVGTLSVDVGTLGGSRTADTFALKVRGDSMIEAQIADGDLAILEKREPRNGDIVAALIDGETTLKRYVTDRGRPFLKAENPRFPSLVPVMELVVQGVLVALVRKYRG